MLANQQKNRDLFNSKTKQNVVISERYINHSIKLVNWFSALVYPGKP